MMGSAAYSLQIATDNLVRLVGLMDEATSSYQNAAAVAITLYDLQGVQIPGTTWPVNLTYVPASNGDYRGTIPNGVQLIRGREYSAVLVADAGPGLFRTWYLRVVAVSSPG